MTLDEYIQTTGITKSEFAQIIPCAYSYPGMIIKGVVPSYRMAKRIEQVTNGLVPRSNWYPVSDPLPDIPIDMSAIVLDVSTSVAA